MAVLKFTIAALSVRPVLRFRIKPASSSLFPPPPLPRPLLLPHMSQPAGSPFYRPVILDSDHFLFDLDDNRPFHYSPSFDISSSPVTPASSHLSLDPMASHLHPSHPLFDSGPFSDLAAISAELDNQNAFFPEWLNDSSLSPTEPSAPIYIPPHSPAVSSPGFNDASLISYDDYSSYAKSPVFSHLSHYPRSADNMFRDLTPSFDNDVISPREMSIHPPQWASNLWETSVSRGTSPQLTEPSSPLFEPDNNYPTERQRFPIKRDPISQVFLSSSAPSVMHVRERSPSLARTYGRRAESVSESDDRNATVRRTKRLHVPDASHINYNDRSTEGQPKSLLRPPKLAPSAWQLYFTDFIQRAQASSTKKLNVAQAAKEAGQEYALLSPEKKEVFKRRSQEAKEARERELSAYMRTLTPEDIKRENAFRTAQRKAGRSRKANMKDPNAPKKPLSAYFMFLQQIRSNPELVRDVFGDESETTKQSVLAAARWRSMTDDERKPFLARAEQEKLDYEAARKLYESGSIAYESSIDFGTAPFTTTTLSPIYTVKSESGESDSEESLTDDSGLRMRS